MAVKIGGYLFFRIMTMICSSDLANKMFFCLVVTAEVHYERTHGDQKKQLKTLDWRKISLKMFIEKQHDMVNN